MKIFLLLVTSAFSLFSFSQNYKMTWGQEIKIKLGTTDMDVVDVDNSGVYFIQGREKPHLTFGFGEPYTTVYKLYKFDKNYSPLFERDYEKELNGHQLYSFQTLNDGLFMFASDLLKKQKIFKVYGGKINKNSGELSPGLMELGSYQMDKSDDFCVIKILPIEGGKLFLVLTRIEGDDRQSVHIDFLDSSLQKKQSLSLNYSFGGIKDVVRDIQYTADKKIALLIRRSEKVIQKKGTEYQFKQYLLMIYNLAGKKEKEISLDYGDRFVSTTQLINHPDGEMIFLGFYGYNSNPKDLLDGFFVTKINTQLGTVTANSYKSMQGDQSENNIDNVKKKSVPEKTNNTTGSQGGFTDNFKIRSIDFNTNDNSIIVTSEYSLTGHSEYRSNTGTSTDFRIVSQDIYVTKADANGQIKWINRIPKSQVEIMLAAEGTYQGYASYFGTSGGMPYYSSYKSLITNNNLIIFLNDHSSSTQNPQPGDKITDLYNFKKSNLYGISIDLVTGKMKRKIVFENNNEDILAPRHAFVLNNEILIPSWRHHYASASELRLAKITVE